ncbi:hypothetical protein ACIF8T_31635 [Streptomyces sp. NPDC085946]|uniref:hypothetical protein n=1 Tax=Streptomyces sp. NPDC085946 TaxID=3365744 RepID=UPI0037D276BF
MTSFPFVGGTSRRRPALLGVIEPAEPVGPADRAPLPGTAGYAPAEQRVVPGRRTGRSGRDTPGGTAFRTCPGPRDPPVHGHGGRRRRGGGR